MLNNVTLCGRLTANPEIRYTGMETGVAVTTFTLAVDRDFKGTNGERGTDFINCVAWRNTAEYISKYFQKGKMMIANGRLQVRSYVNENDGQKRYVTEVIVNNAYFAGDKPKTETMSNQTNDDDFEDITAFADSDDLPF